MGKSKVKIFDGRRYAHELEEDINKFLENKNIAVKNISFSVDIRALYSYKAIVLYEEKQ